MSPIASSHGAPARSVSTDTYKPIGPRVPIPPSGPRPMAPTDIANVVHLDGSELTRWTVAGKAVQR